MRDFHFLRFVAVVALAMPNASFAQGRVDILQVWQNFTASQAAASRCGKPGDDSDTHFMANFLAVRIRAEQAMRERNSTLTTEEAGRQMETAEGEIHRKVVTEIEQNGCSSPRIVQLMQLHAMHRNMNLYGDR